MNVVVVTGRLSRSAEERVLPSGDRLVGLELSMPAETGGRESVPVAWPEPPDWAAGLAVGTEIVVLGRVRRRFFRSGGSTQSRTEIVAERVVRASQHRRVAALLARGQARLDADEPAPPD